MLLQKPARLLSDKKFAGRTSKERVSFSRLLELELVHVRFPLSDVPCNLAKLEVNPAFFRCLLLLSIYLFL